MTTNILILPQLAAIFTLATNSDWRDAIQFLQPSPSTNPLDLTGISFRGQLRASAADPTVRLEFSTDNGLMVNGGADGILTWAVPYTALQGLAPGAYAFDLVAVADGMQLNLFRAAPAAVTVNVGVTR